MHILPSLVLVSFLLLLLPRLTHSFADPGTRPSTTCDAKRSTDPNDPGNPCSLRGDQLRGRHINITFTEIEYFMQFNRDKADTTSDPKGRLIFEDEATGLLFRSSPVMSTYAVGTAGGYLNDMIGWIADHAGFTYSAYIASGRCNNIDTKRPWHSDYAGEYVEGQKDVYNINCTNKFPNDPQKGRTDAYIGMYFITNGRHTLNDFTLPFLSNKGLSIGMLATEKGTILQRLAKQDSSDGTCQAIIAPDTNLEAAENRWIHEGEQTTMKRVIDTSWQYGYKEHAIGVRKDFPELTDTLNYWIHELSLAATATDNPLSLTYVGNNIDEMFRKAVGEKTVALGESYSLGVENFLGPIFVAFGLGLFVTIVSCWNHRDLFAYRTRFFGISPNAPLSIHKFLKTHHKECINEDGTMRMQRMMLKFRDNRYNSEFQRTLTEALLNYYVLTDVPAFRLIKHTRNLLESHLKILDLVSQTQRDHFHVNDDYVSHIVRNCNHTIEVLLWRALRESGEATDAAAIMEVQKRLLGSKSDQGMTPGSPRGDLQHETRARALTEEETLELRKRRLSLDQTRAKEQAEMEASAASKRMTKRLKSVSKMAIHLNKSKVLPFGLVKEAGGEGDEDSNESEGNSPNSVKWGVDGFYSGLGEGA